MSLPPSRALRWLREAGPRRRDTAAALRVLAAFGPAAAACHCLPRGRFAGFGRLVLAAGTPLRRFASSRRSARRLRHLIASLAGASLASGGWSSPPGHHCGASRPRGVRPAGCGISLPPSRALRWLREAGPRRRDTTAALRVLAAFGPPAAACHCLPRGRFAGFGRLVLAAGTPLRRFASSRRSARRLRHVIASLAGASLASRGWSSPPGHHCGASRPRGVRPAGCGISLPPSRALRWLREAGPRRRDTTAALRVLAAFGPPAAAYHCLSRGDVVPEARRPTV